ncbi:MAG TPA: hypothetical protein VHD81_04890 [Mycobacteriales bacterium]|nr:hypothetical protein [Mycobacteriales bacterium]
MKSARSNVGKVAGVVLAAAVASSVALPASASTPLTKAHARNIAKHINVKSSDYPGFKVHPYQSSKGAKATEKKYDGCVGFAPAFVRAHSDSYDNGKGALFSSVTEFVSSRAVAQHDDELAASQKARDCFKQELMDIAKAVNASDTQVTVSPESEAPVAGMDAIYAMKYTATFTVIGYHGTLHGWSVGFSRGNVEVSLNEIGTMDVPRANLNNALATLQARLTAKIPADGRPVKQ